jgi:predicted RNA-binding protein Jag
MVKMIESLPGPVQDQVVEHLRDYLEDLRDEMQWDASVRLTEYRLVAEAKRARQQVAEGHAEPMDYDRL